MTLAVHESIRTRDAQHGGHTRLPAYLAGKRGTVERVVGEFPFPDDVAAGVRDSNATLYTIRFEGRELWSGADCNAVYADLFEPYLEQYQ